MFKVTIISTTKLFGGYEYVDKQEFTSSSLTYDQFCRKIGKSILGCQGDDTIKVSVEFSNINL